MTPKNRNTSQLNLGNDILLEESNEFVTKYRKLVEALLIVVGIVVSSVLIDFYFLPKTTVNDEITHYRIEYVRNKAGSSRTAVAYRFFTAKGHSFTTEKTFIEENDITIEFTSLFKNNSKVYSSKTDYSKKISSGLTGVLLYLFDGFLFSIVCSLIILHTKKNIGENSFYNIICLNSFLLFLCLCILYLY
ncbi:hypothetical protein [Flavobacterium sp.]|uniref:hypothetical protein n=1 Tax=Flavobacterium sp. TaxID=239 RepID=UPI002624A7FD|nr:hypothetical protein [Flavobacterium sp.]MDG2431439.1 hypothetical protein [Flavobacterium sp.]